MDYGFNVIHIEDPTHGAEFSFEQFDILDKYISKSMLTGG